MVAHVERHSSLPGARIVRTAVTGLSVALLCDAATVAIVAVAKRGVLGQALPNSAAAARLTIMRASRQVAASQYSAV